MKKKKLQQKLELNKTTISNLNQLQMNRLIAGVVAVRVSNRDGNECCTEGTPQCEITCPDTACQTCPETNDNPCECKINVIEPVQLT